MIKTMVSLIGVLRKSKVVVVWTWKTTPVLNQQERAGMNRVNRAKKFSICPYPQLLGKVQLTIST